MVSCLEAEDSTLAKAILYLHRRHGAVIHNIHIRLYKGTFSIGQRKNICKYVVIQ